MSEYDAPKLSAEELRAFLSILGRIAHDGVILRQVAESLHDLKYCPAEAREEDWIDSKVALPARYGVPVEIRGFGKGFLNQLNSDLGDSCWYVYVKDNFPTLKGMFLTPGTHWRPLRK